LAAPLSTSFSGPRIAMSTKGSQPFFGSFAARQFHYRFSTSILVDAMDGRSTP
jgi:hypothetical protein